MKITSVVSIAVLSMSIISGVATASDRVGDFSLLDQIGNHHKMSWYDDNKSIALLVQANGSDATLAAIPRYINLHQTYSVQGIQFFMINPMGHLNRDAVNAEISPFTTEIPVLMDDSRQVSADLGVNNTGEVFLFDPSSFRVVFRGPVGDEFEAALTAIIDDQQIVDPAITMTGSDVSYKEPTSISYQHEIAPIIAENCATCHRKGGIAPFALDSYAMAQGWSPMIREVLMTKRMPPGQIDQHVHEFENSRYLAINDFQKMIAWIDAGSPRDGDTDPLAELSWPQSKWTVPYGEPDLIVKVPRQTIPATGVLDYIHLQVPINGMKTDRWVRASEFVPGDRTVVHHSTARVGGPESFRNPDVAILTRFVPGQEPRIEPPDTGGLLKKDSVLNVTMHYTTTGKEAVDESEYGIWFYPEGEVPKERMSARMVGVFANDWETIPPYAKNFEVSNTFTMTDDVYVYAYHPHMHFRGRDLRMYADYPDGTREELINVANYSFAWQLTYQLKEPLFMPKGTVITSIGHFDNSVQNLFNPDPSLAVPWGEQSWDEMFFGEIVFKTSNEQASN